MNMIMKHHRAHSRPVVLLEVMIAFALVVLCVLPLIYPHIAILKAEKAFVADIELDHLVNLLYADRLYRLYQKEIPWADIESGKPLPIDENMLQPLGYKGPLPFDGCYYFEKVRQKPRKSKTKTIYLFKLIFEFTPKVNHSIDDADNTLVYKYNVMIEHRQP